MRNRRLFCWAPACLAIVLSAVAVALSAESSADAQNPALAASDGNRATNADADDWQPGAGRGRGPGPHGHGWRGGRGPGAGRGGPQGPGRAGDPVFEADREMFHFLADNRAKIHRRVKLRDDGVETLTESKVPQVAAAIQEHVAAMHRRITEPDPIRMRDPLFAAVFQSAEKIVMQIENTEQGVRVVETSTDPLVAKLIQAHAKVVTLFLKNGYPELRANHAAPGAD